MSDQPKLCRATRRDGTTHCQRLAVDGTDFCRKHGGSAAQLSERWRARRMYVEVVLDSLTRAEEEDPADSFHQYLDREASYFLRARRIAIDAGADLSALDQRLRDELDASP